ncbi:MAG: DUF4342 domain-containing protein [Armatimonadetes bacterium]|nr:DUF4342 domain-containing protein [Armatimonadota bacterium]
MDQSVPKVTPDKGATLAVDDTAPAGTLDEVFEPTPLSEGDSPHSTSTLPEPDPQADRHAEPQPASALRLTANTSDMVEIGAMLFQEAEAILRTGQKRRIKVRLGRRTIAEMPLATGAIGVMLAAMAAVALSRLTLELE